LLAGLAEVGPHTVIRPNETRHYLLTEGSDITISSCLFAAGAVTGPKHGGLKLRKPEILFLRTRDVAAWQRQGGALRC